MNTKQLVLLGMGMIAVAVGLLIYSSAVSQTRVGPAKPMEEGRCPDCGRDIPSRAGGECPFCKLTQAKGGKGTEGREFTRTDYVLFFLIVFLAGGGGYLIVRSTGHKFRRRKRNAPTFHTRCPHCKRKVRYFADQAGRPVLCPTCHWTLTPPVPSA
jgi:hypothetical protein